MPPLPLDLLAARLSRLRDDMRVAGVEALLVTNLFNLRYLTRFSGTAGAAVVTDAQCRLLVDFRYIVSAREAIADAPIEIAIVEHTYDDGLVALLQASSTRRIGIEATSLTVSRFNRLSRALGDLAVLVPTERLVERRRAVKDVCEVAT